VIEHYKINEVGRDYAVGDIHGCFKMLEDKLYEVGFDEKTDRLFSVGDMVDRGPHSERCLEWLQKPWFHAILGNHEQMAINASEGFIDMQNYRWNGGQWFLDLPVELQKEFAQVFLKLPIAIEIETKDGLVGMIHAELPLVSWKDLDAALQGPNSESFIDQCLWNRDRLRNGLTTVISDIKEVIVGHSVVHDDVWFGNVHYIDTGAVFGKKLTVIQIN
jgi:serine/threonine protein phosphatase 1